MKRAIFPGSFDPITKGHEAIILQALSLFDEVIIAIGLNISKKNKFSLEQRLQWIKDVFAEYPKVKVIHYEGLTIDLCRKLDIGYIIRGLRTSHDFEYESLMAEANKKLNPDVKTIFFIPEPSLRCISSTLVYDLVKHNHSVEDFVSEKVKIIL